jgi:hypothetical protein
MMTVRYAVLWKIHYWDDFAERRFRYLLSKVGTGDVHVFVDETHGPVGPIAHEHVIRATESDMAKLDVVLEPPGKVFWYNVDYPLYFFYLQNRSYDYYLVCEHDAVLNIDVDEFVRVADRDRVDYVGFPSAPSGWPLQTGEGVYPKSVKLYQWLSCISLHSKRSVEFLLKRRQILTRHYTAGEIANWPNNEVFIPTEMQNNGFVVRELGDFGKVDKYDWWPPSLEDDLPLLKEQAFLHPVLDERRYLASCMRYSNLWSYLLPGSQIRRLLDRWSTLSLTPALLKELTRQVILQVSPAFLLDLIPRARNAANFQRLLRRSPHAN